MPITSYFTKNNRQMAFSYNPISMVRAGKPGHCPKFCVNGNRIQL